MGRRHAGLDCALTARSLRARPDRPGQYFRRLQKYKRYIFSLLECSSLWMGHVSPWQERLLYEDSD